MPFRTQNFKSLKFYQYNVQYEKLIFLVITVIFIKFQVLLIQHTIEKKTHVVQAASFQDVYNHGNEQKLAKKHVCQENTNQWMCSWSESSVK